MPRSRLCISISKKAKECFVKLFCFPFVKGMNHRHQLKEQLMQTVLPIEVTFKTKRSSVDDESDMGLKAHDISSSIIPNVSSEIDFPSLS